MCLSFAEEERGYVEEVAESLKHKGVRVFYDRYELVALWGKDLYSHLDDIYQNSARYCVVFASNRYAKKIWTNHELRSAQARAIKEKHEYILPARFDDTAIPGLPDTINYINLKSVNPVELANLIVQKIGVWERENYFPADPDYLFKQLKCKTNSNKYYAYKVCLEFFNILKRLTDAEKEVLLTIILLGCHAELPENIHVDVERIVEATGLTIKNILRDLSGISVFGFECKSIQFHDDHGNLNEHIDIMWNQSQGKKFVMDIVYHMVHGATDGYCVGHAMAALRRNDFSQLSSDTFRLDEHQ